MSEDGEWSEIVEMIRRAHDPESQAVASSDSSVHAHVVGSGLDSVFKTHDNLFRAARTILDLVGHQIIYRGSIARSIFSKARAIVDCASVRRRLAASCHRSADTTIQEIKCRQKGMRVYRREMRRRRSRFVFSYGDE